MTDISDAAPRVSMRRALSAAFDYAFSRFGYIMRISWPLFLMILLPIAVQYLYGPLPSFHFTTAEEFRNNLGLISTVVGLMLVYLILFVLIEAAYFILFARDYFLGERPARVQQVFGATLGRYLLLCLLGMCTWLGFVILTAVVVGIVSALNKTAGGAIAIVLFPAVFIGQVYIFCRWMTWPVSHAVGKPQTLGETWRSSAKAAWKIFAGYVVLTIGFLLVFFIIIAVAVFAFGFDMFPHGFPPKPPIAAQQPGLVTQLVLSIVQTVLYQVGMAISAVFLADIFKQIRSSS